MANVKVLIVEDDEFQSDYYEIAFQEGGMDVAKASNAEDAIIVASAFIPDIILLDLHLGDYKSFQVVRMLRMKQVTRDIPVIFISSDKNDEDVRQGHFLGAVDFLSKTPEVGRLADYIRNTALLEGICNSLRKARDILEKID